MSKPEEIEILDEDLDLNTHTTARAEDTDTDGWDETPNLGRYLGDGVYTNA